MLNFINLLGKAELASIGPSNQHIPSNFQPSIVYVCLASLTINVLSLSLPLFSLQIYDRILTHQAIGTLHVLLVVVVTCIILEATLRIIRNYTTTWTGAVFEHQTSCQAIEHLLRSEPMDVERPGVSANLQSMTSIATLREFVGGQVMVCVIDLPFVCLYIGLIGFIAGYLVLVPLAILTVFALLAWGGSYELKTALIDREAINQRRTSFLIETLGGIHSVKFMGAEAGFLRRYERLQAQASTLNHRIAFASGGAIVVGSVFSQIMMIAVTSTGAAMAINGNLSVGTLVASVLLSGRIMQPIQRALGLWIRFQDISLADQRVQRLFAAPIMTDSDLDSSTVDRKGKLDVEDLTFSYDKDGADPLFRDINLSLKLGDSISVSGGHASGKSTLLKLLAGLSKPTSGSVLIDGIEAHSYPSRELVSHVGYLATRGTIFNGTVLENLSGFDPSMELASRELARLLGIEDTIASLPHGYDTNLSDGGADAIPSGIKQCIALARVLAHKPRLLLFDNADRALDQENYNHLFRLLGRLKGKASMIIVSDDRNFLRLAQAEYLLVDGHLVERDVTQDSKVHDVKAFKELRL